MIRSIGVCNFHIPHLQRLIDETGIAPTVNQIELHPLLQQRQLHAWNATHHIATESWSPLAQGGKGVLIKKLSASSLSNIINACTNRDPLASGQWADCYPQICHTSTYQRNFEVFDFKLQKEELLAITKLDCGKRLGPDPEVSDLTADFRPAITP